MIRIKSCIILAYFMENNEYEQKVTILLRERTQTINNNKNYIF